LSRFGVWVSALAGVLHTASFAPTHAWFLQPLALWLLASACWAAVGTAGASARRRIRRCATMGMAFGLGWLVSGLWWLFISMHHFGRLPAWVSALAVLLLAAFLSLYYAGALALWSWGLNAWCPSKAMPESPPEAVSGRGRGRPPAALALSWAGVWLLAELARASWFSGFPWIAGGYAHTVGPLAAWAPWVGVYGIGFAAACWAALAAAKAWRSWLVLSAALLGMAWMPADFTRSAGSLNVTLLQPNVPQDQKFDPALIQGNLETLALQIEQAPAGLVVTPESAVPLATEDLPPSFVRRLKGVSEREGSALLWGIFTGDAQGGYMNSVLGWGGEAQAGTAATELAAAAQGEGYVYGKRHLLPFGETIPWGFKGFVRAMGIPMDDQARGQHDRPFEALGQAMRPLICFEDLFPEEMAASVAQGGATVLVNFSNLAWFGRWMVQDQHLQFSQMRALEFQRPLVRSTNTGATAAIDHRGQVFARLPTGVRGSLSVQVQARSGVTPLAAWMSRWGLMPLWLLGLLAVALPAWALARLPRAHA
jgi:apolipoprotein N-acyltransferase